MDMETILRGTEPIAASHAAAPEAPATGSPLPGIGGTAAEPTGEPTETGASSQTAQSATPGTKDGWTVPGSALQEERRKRQEERRERERLEAELAQYRRQSSAPPPKAAEPEPEPWNEKVFEDLPGAFKAVEARLEKRLTAHKYATSERMARQFLPDYDQVIEQYTDAVRANPYLAKVVDDSATPALEAYQATKRYLEAKDSNPQAIEARVRNEMQSKMQALEQELQQLKAHSTAGNVPSSLTSARGSGAASGNQTAWSGPPPMSDILKFGARR